MAQIKQDKRWMLNVRAISCIWQVENQLDIKLKLSHPDFLELLLQYTELTDSSELQRSVEEPAQCVPADCAKKLLSRIEELLLIEEQSEPPHSESAPAPIQG